MLSIQPTRKNKTTLSVLPTLVIHQNDVYFNRDCTLCVVLTRDPETLFKSVPHI